MLNYGYLSHDIVPRVAAAVVSAARPKGRRRTVCGGPSGPEQVGAEWAGHAHNRDRCLSQTDQRWLAVGRCVAMVKRPTVSNRRTVCCDGRLSPPANVSYSPMVGRRFSTLEKGLWRVAKQTRVKCTGLCAFSSNFQQQRVEQSRVYLVQFCAAVENLLSFGCSPSCRCLFFRGECA